MELKDPQNLMAGWRRMSQQWNQQWTGQRAW